MRADAGRPLAPGGGTRRRAWAFPRARSRQFGSRRAPRARGAKDRRDHRTTGPGCAIAPRQAKARAMAHVSVMIDGRKYRLACNEGEEERLTSIAGMVDGKIGELRSTFGEIGDQRLVVMAALTFADNLTEAREEAAAERERAQAAAARSEAAATKLDALGARLEALAGQLAGEAEA